MDWDQYHTTVAAQWAVRQVCKCSQALTAVTDIGLLGSLVVEITDILIQAADGPVPVAKPCLYSQRWWSPELTTLKCIACRLSNRVAQCSTSLEDVAPHVMPSRSTAWQSDIGSAATGMSMLNWLWNSLSGKPASMSPKPLKTPLLPTSPPCTSRMELLHSHASRRVLP